MTGFLNFYFNILFHDKPKLKWQLIIKFWFWKSKDQNKRSIPIKESELER